MTHIGLDVLRLGLTNRCFFWKYLGVGDYGKPNVEDPIVIKCRWHFTEKKSVSTEGDDKEKSAEIHVDRHLPVGSYVQLIMHDEQVPELVNAWQVKGIDVATKNWERYTNIYDAPPGTVNFKATIGN